MIPISKSGNLTDWDPLEKHHYFFIFSKLKNATWKSFEF